MGISEGRKGAPRKVRRSGRRRWEKARISGRPALARAAAAWRARGGSSSRAGNWRRDSGLSRGKTRPDPRPAGVAALAGATSSIRSGPIPGTRPESRSAGSACLENPESNPNLQGNRFPPINRGTGKNGTGLSGFPVVFAVVDFLELVPTTEGQAKSLGKFAGARLAGSAGAESPVGRRPEPLIGRREGRALGRLLGLRAALLPLSAPQPAAGSGG
jgi:hypothetical protein